MKVVRLRRIFRGLFPSPDSSSQLSKDVSASLSGVSVSLSRRWSVFSGVVESENVSECSDVSHSTPESRGTGLWGPLHRDESEGETQQMMIYLL